MTVFENVAFPLVEKTKLPRDEIAERVQETLKAVGLEGMEIKLPLGDERRDAEAGRAGASIGASPQNPDARRADHRPRSRRAPGAIHELIRRTQENFHLTAVMVSHDVPEVFQVSDRVAFLHNGRTRLNGTVAEVMAADDEVFKRFLAGKASGEENGTALRAEKRPMYATRTTQFIVGIFAILGIAALAILSISLGKISLLPTPGYTLYARFDNISGLKTGDQVQLTGVQIGKVVHIGLKDIARGLRCG